MAILRIATSPAELSVFGGTYNTTDTTKFDPTRTRGVFQHTELQLSSLQWPEVSGDTTWIHFEHALNRNTANPQFWSNSLLEVKDSFDRRMFYIDMNPTMRWRAQVDSGSVTSQATQQVLSEGTLFAVDVKIVVGATIDCEVYFNGALQGSASIANTQNATNPDRLQFGIFDNDTGSSSSGRTWFGEFIVADEDTRGFRLRELTPQSFGVFQQWDGTVASIVDGSLATGISTDTADERVSFGLANLDSVDPGDIVNRIVAQSYAQRGASGLTSINHFFRYDDTTIQDGPDINLGLTGGWHLDEYTTNPKTAAAWTPGDLAGIQVGVRART